MQTILVIDDEFGILEVLEATLADAGYRIVTAVNGRQGLERAAAHAPSLIILDFMMPILDGPAVLRALAADAALKDIPVILMTALSEEVARRQASGYAAFIRKPFSMKSILGMVRGILGAE